jgi:hypothetical protein
VGLTEGRAAALSAAILVGLSGDIPVAHKVGMKGGVINDSGIVYLGGNPFVISMFTDTDDPDNGIQAIRDVARAAAAFYGR